MSDTNSVGIHLCRGALYQFEQLLEVIDV